MKGSIVLKRGLSFMNDALVQLEEGTLEEFLGRLSEVELSSLLTISKSLETSAFLSFSDVFRASTIVDTIEKLME